MRKRNRKGSQRSLLILAVLILAAMPVRAQINTENLRKADRTEGQHHTLSLDYNLVTGNEDEEDFINMGFFRLRLIRRLNPRLRGEFFGQNEFNDIILLENRILFGGGFASICCRNEFVDTISGAG